MRMNEGMEITVVLALDGLVVERCLAYCTH